MVNLTHLRPYFLWLSCLTVHSYVTADTIQLSNGDKLTGNIESITADTLNFHSASTPHTLSLYNSAIERVTFSTQNVALGHVPDLVTLQNGDLIPCSILSLNDTDFSLHTPYTGKLNIPRKAVANVELNRPKRTPLYTFHNDLSEWVINKGMWQYTPASKPNESNALTCRKSSDISRKLNLDGNLHFSFDLNWNNQPDFKFHFCAEEETSTRQKKTYELHISSNVIQINNLSSNTVLIQHHTEYDYSENSLHIEIKLNKEDETLSLIVDDEVIETSYYDSAPLNGNYIAFINESNNNNRLTIKNFAIKPLNTRAYFQEILEEIDQLESDLILDNQGEKLIGSLKSISASQTNNTPNKKDSFVSFLHGDQELIIPRSRIKLLYTHSKENKGVKHDYNFTLYLRNGGVIYSSELTFIEGRLHCSHHVLGEFDISPDKISHLVTNS